MNVSLCKYYDKRKTFIFRYRTFFHEGEGSFEFCFFNRFCIFLKFKDTEKSFFEKEI